MNSWLKNAIFYQIYPISFYDKNNDGFGDLLGIIDKLDYIQEMGFNALWLNPIYSSPFMDGGYDISDYYSIDKRFGNMSDFENLVRECKKRDIKILMDLVIGHTSSQHKWFMESAKDEKNDFSNYYIWTDSNYRIYKDRTICGMYPRDGSYYINYYAVQPALNFGFNHIDSKEQWQYKYDDERLSPLRNEIFNICRFWMNKGVDGFRVDLASSLVKECKKTSKHVKDIEGLIWLWRKILGQMRSEFPNICFISEWAYPANSVGKCGFDCDFYTHEIKCYNHLFRNEKNNNLLPVFEEGYNYFGEEGKGSIKSFLSYSLPLFKILKGKGYFSVPTGSHDQIRLATFKGIDELKVIFAFLLTFKHVPFVLYGDELGIKHTFGLNKDGGYNRTGARTPMLWNEGKNKGFSQNDTIYLPVTNCESVESQSNDKESLLNTVKKLIEIRKSYSCLNADGDFEIVSKNNKGYPFVYKRKDSNNNITVAINPGKDKHKIKANILQIIFSNNCDIKNDEIILQGQSFVIYIEK